MRQIYYKLRDSLLPYGTRRRKVVKNIYNKVLSGLGIDKNKMLQTDMMRGSKYYLWDYKINKELVVLTTKHCMFVARLIKESARKAGVEVEIILEKPEDGFKNLPHIVIAPQMFKELPDMYVAYQMEQSVSSRWFTEEYYKKLNAAVAVFDYSLKNIEFLSNKIELNKLYYLPISGMANLVNSTYPNKKEYDVIFYGDDSCERRKRILEEVSRECNVKIINDLFGEELYKELSKAKIILNIHYYEGALLETTRIYESLSLNTSIIISEKSIDFNEHKYLEDLIEFVDIDDTKALIEKIKYYLEDDNRILEKLNTPKAINEYKDVTAFDYYFQRFLLATDNISFDDFYNNVSSYINFNGDFWCLGLPEYTERKKAFDKVNNIGIEYFPGIRHYYGWIGCGMSYKFLMRKARLSNLKSVTVCEDDIYLPSDFVSNLKIVKEYLKGTQWDVFSGLIADVNEESRISYVENHKGIEFVHLDKMVSMVFNIYNKNFMNELELWDEKIYDSAVNTIDRYIENNINLNVVTTSPFLVSCNNNLKSTLWNFQNIQYNSLIDKSVKTLNEKIARYKNEGND